MFTAEERVMGEDETRNIHVELVVPLRVCRTSNVQICILGLKGLAEKTTLFNVLDKDKLNTLDNCAFLV